MPPEAPPPPPQPQATGMWGTISSVLTSGNAVYLFVFIVAIALVFGLLAKLGVFSIHKKGIRIGKNTALTERLILKKQLEYVQKYCLALEPVIAKIFDKKHFDNEGARMFYFRYLALIISNEAEKGVLVNNIKDTPEYINLKVYELKAFILSQVGLVKYDEQLFDTKLRECVKEAVEHLELIRKSNATLG